ncbi:MAG: helix-turn-helix domain-containing protein [Acidobacteria bacterium]|nr:helix-turn-helix domain-containing protein [Acidobacteriota bacterium]
MDGLGARLREYRLRAELSQAGLARAAGISKAYLSELEADAGRRPSADVLLRVADALSVTIADLLGRSVEPAEPARIPPGLREFARERGLSVEEVRALAQIRLREGTPRTKERWAFIYDAIKGSGHLDRKR